MRALLASALLGLAACAAPAPNLDPTGAAFPSVLGTSLEGQDVRLPEALGGEPAVILVGYVQDTQFDLDRWILGLMQAETPVRILEVPTITGFFPGLIAGTIDDGMRSGIPQEDWGSVVTLYGDEAERVKALTGEESPRNGRVMLLDGEGRIVWFHDRGYSAGQLLALDERARSLVDG